MTVSPTPTVAHVSTDVSTHVAVLVVGSERAARERTIASLEQQSCNVFVLEAGHSLATVDAPVSLIVHAGVELEYTACERLAWLLGSTAHVGWVTGGSLEHPQPESLLDALLTLCAVRTADARAALGHARWVNSGCDGRDTPGVAMQLVLAMWRQGVRGVCMGQPPIARYASGSEWVGLTGQARVTAEMLGHEVAECLAATETHVPDLPLQRLDRSLWPTTHGTTPEPPSAGQSHRILMLLQGFPMGGYTAFNADLVPRLVARGHHVTTVCTEWWRPTWRLAHVRRVAPDIHHVQSSSALAAIPAYIAHLISSRDIDVVFLSHSFLSYRMLPLLRAAFPHVAFVDYVHTEWFEDRMYGSYATMSARYTTYLDAHIASSQALAASLVQQGAVAARTHVAHIGIDTTTWRVGNLDREGVRAAFGAGPDTTLLLFAGRVSPEKRPLLAVDALDALRAEGRDVRLVVAGDGPQLQDVNELLERRGLSSYAAMLGEVDEDTLRQVYAAADIYFAPSEIEGIARTLYEAMAMGCVPVVSDVGGQRELVMPELGSLVPLHGRDVAPYLPSLRQWCESAPRAAASIAARRHIVGAFDSEHTMHAIEAALQSATARAAHRVSLAPAALDTIDDATAEELAVLGLELMRRHTLQVSTRR